MVPGPSRGGPGAPFWLNFGALWCTFEHRGVSFSVYVFLLIFFMDFWVRLGGMGVKALGVGSDPGAVPGHVFLNI